MNQQLINYIAAGSLKRELPKIVAGMTVCVSQKIKEGEKERIQNFDGLVIAANGSGVNSTFTVRKIIGGVGVEKVFLLHSKNTVKIEVVKKAKIRRSKLYFMRELRGKAARMSEIHVREVVLDEEAAKKTAAELKKKEDAVKVKAEKTELVGKNEEKIEQIEMSAEAELEKAEIEFAEDLKQKEVKTIEKDRAEN